MMLNIYSLLLPLLLSLVPKGLNKKKQGDEAIDDKPRDKRKVHGILNASSKICSLVVNGQSFLVTDGSLLNLF